jgi:hypothetical protein
MRLQQQQQEVLSQQQQQQQQQQGMNGGAGKQLSPLSSADLEALLPLEPTNTAAAAGGDQQQPPAAAAAALEQQNSFMLLLEGIDSLPMQMDSNIDALLNPSANPLLNEPMPQQYAAQQQQLQQQQQQQVGSGGSPYTPAASAPAGYPHQQQQQRGDEDGMGGLDIPDDYAAFLVDDDDLAAVGAEGTAGQRKRVRSGVGAGISSCSLDLRKLSDLLMGGSSMQLIEGSAWHKLCRSSFSRGGRSGPAALGGGGVGDDVDDACTADAAAAAAAGSGVGDDEDDLHALLGLRDMSITR